MPKSSSSPQSGGVRRPGSQAQDHRPRLHRSVRRRGEEAEGVKWLAQGTIYPDVIESAGASKTGKAHVIKSHHNVGGLPEDMKMGLVEPLRELFKDEVRKRRPGTGPALRHGLPPPVPGPGLGVRVLGEVKKEYATCCAAPMPSSSKSCARPTGTQGQPGLRRLPAGEVVGVMGDGRKYDWVIALRAVETIDFMTARWAHLPYDLLETCRTASSTRSTASPAWCTTSPASRQQPSSGNLRVVVTHALSGQRV
jgi:GMP synthase (glutamine-hydrolysing) B subunit